jgi:hypothetical protein
MPAIKITLNRLIELFGKSTSDIEALQSLSLTESATALPKLAGGLAARLMTLTAHTMRIDQKVDVRVKALSEQIAQLTDIVQALAQPQQAAPSASTPAEVAPAPSPTDEVNKEEESEAAFFARAQQEAEAEVAAINAAPVAEVTQLPRSKKAGGSK